MSGPAVILKKSTNGEDADDPPGPAVRMGSTVTWVYDVTNVGNVLLTGVTIVDDNGTPDDPADDVIVATGVELPVGVSRRFLVTGIAQAGLYRNVATVTTDQGVSDEDASHYEGVGRVSAPKPAKAGHGLAGHNGYSDCRWCGFPLAAVSLTGLTVALLVTRRVGGFSRLWK